MSHERSTTRSVATETLHQPDYELAGSLQAILHDIDNRDFSLDIQQSEALEAIGHALINGTSSGYIEMATSTGKTTVESLLAEATAKAGKRVLILASTIPIAEQIAGNNPDKPTGLKRFTTLPQDATVRYHYGSKKGTPTANIIVSTYAGFLNDFKNGHERLGEFDVVIGDECHRSLGKETSEALRSSMPDAFKLGLSATPDYALDRKSEEVWGTSLYEFSLLEAVENGKTAPVRAFLYETDQTLTLSDPRREFTDRELAPLINNIQRNGTAVALAKAFVEEGRQGIIACVPGDHNLHARLMADLLKQSGIRSVDIGAHLDTDTQARRLLAYQQGAVDVLTFTRALEEGWDSDKASFAINLVPTSSPVRTTQLLGRVLRKKPGDQESVFVDFVDEKKGKSKSQYTALHALGLEEIDISRVLGRHDNTTSWNNQTLKNLHAISPKIYKRLMESQGKLLSDISVGPAIDPLQLEWEQRLAKEGLPAELPSNDVLPPALAKRVTKAYEMFYRDNGVPPTVEELIEMLGDVSPPYRKALGSYAIRSELDRLEELDRHDIAVPLPEGDVHTAWIKDRRSRELIQGVLDTLSEREATVIIEAYGLNDGEPKNLAQIGRDHLRVKRERVRQIEAKTMSKMRHPVRSKRLRELLDDEPYEAESTIEKSHETKASQNYFINQLHDFEVVSIPEIVTDFYSNGLYLSGSVGRAREMLGIYDPNLSNKEMFAIRSLEIEEALNKFNSKLEQLYDLPVADNEASYAQRLKTIEVYESRVAYLKILAQQLKQLKDYYTEHLPQLLN